MQRVPSHQMSTGSDIWVTGGTATGEHRLTAFDAALADAGIHNANLIRISSITPVDATRHRVDEPGDLAARIPPGSMVPSVYARSESNVAGERIYAAVSGVRLEDGYGINVETHGTSDTRESVRNRCERMLADMARTREQSFDTEPWLRFESCRVPEPPDEATWAAAVAAIVYP